MAGGLVKYRHLGRSSAHRQALLRNLVTSLIKLETIHTTWHKAKEAQRLAERLISYAKRDNEETRRKAQAILFTPHLLMNKLFGTLKTRYAVRPSGYTRVLRTEPKDTYDQAPSAILELVDGPRDMRFAMTAATVARDRMLGKPHTDLTRRNMAKVTQYPRPNGMADFEAMVKRTAKLRLADEGPQIDELADVRWNRNPEYRIHKVKPRHDYWAPEAAADASGRKTARRALAPSVPRGETQPPKAKPAPTEKRSFISDLLRRRA